MEEGKKKKKVFTLYSTLPPCLVTKINNFVMLFHAQGGVYTGNARSGNYSREKDEMNQPCYCDSWQILLLS